MLKGEGFSVSWILSVLAPGSLRLPSAVSKSSKGSFLIFSGPFAFYAEI